MTAQELYAKLQATKHYLNTEVVRNKTNGASLLTFREIDKRLDMIHEAERIGVRNLGEHQTRKLTRMIGELENRANIALN